ncbi:MAG: hypothetical protein AB1630_11385 [bacterium]
MFKQTLRSKRIACLITLGLLTGMGWAQDEPKGTEALKPKEALGTGTEEVHPVYPEEYVPKVIIEGNVGTETGDFGYNGIEGVIVGPQEMILGNDGYLYIVDTANNRIQRFDTEGKYISSIPVDSFRVKYNDERGKPLRWPDVQACGVNLVGVDSRSRVYVREVPDNLNIYSKEGDLIKRYSMEKIKKEIEAIEDKEIEYIDVKIDKSGNCYFEAREHEDKEPKVFRIDSKEKLSKSKASLKAMGVRSKGERVDKWGNSYGITTTEPRLIKEIPKAETDFYYQEVDKYQNEGRMLRVYGIEISGKTLWGLWESEVYVHNSS